MKLNFRNTKHFYCFLSLKLEIKKNISVFVVSQTEAMNSFNTHLIILICSCGECVSLMGDIIYGQKRNQNSKWLLVQLELEIGESNKNLIGNRAKN